MRDLLKQPFTNVSSAEHSLYGDLEAHSLPLYLHSQKNEEIMRFLLYTSIEAYSLGERGAEHGRREDWYDADGPELSDDGARKPTTCARCLLVRGMWPLAYACARGGGFSGGVSGPSGGCYARRRGRAPDAQALPNLDPPGLAVLLGRAGRRPVHRCGGQSRH